MAAPNRQAARELALALAFEGRWSQAEIAKKCEVSPRTIWAWLNNADFQAELAAMRDDFTASLRGVAYAGKAQRIVALSQMAESARREYEARPWLQEVRPTPNGDVTNESFNRDAHAAFRDSLNDIAKELGERSSNVNVNAQYNALSVTVIMERMRSDRTIARQADDLLASLTGAAGASIGA